MNFERSSLNLMSKYDFIYQHDKKVKGMPHMLAKYVNQHITSLKKYLTT